MDEARKTRPVKIHMSEKWGLENAIQVAFLGGPGRHIWPFLHAFCAIFGATICSGCNISQKCHFFSEVFKALTSKEFLSYCFYLIISLRKISGKRLTVGANGHNLVTVRTQHLVSNHEGKRGHFWHSPLRRARTVSRPLFPSNMSLTTTIGLHFWGISGSPSRRKGRS